MFWRNHARRFHTNIVCKWTLRVALKKNSYQGWSGAGFLEHEANAARDGEAPEGSNLERRVGNSDVGDPTNRTPEEGEREERKSGGGKEMDGKANTILI